MGQLPDLSSPDIHPAHREYFRRLIEQDVRAGLRAAAYAGSTRGDKKLLLVRICDEANPFGVATIYLPDLSAELGHPEVLTRRLLSKLISRGDLMPLSRRNGCRTFYVKPRQ